MLRDPRVPGCRIRAGRLDAGGPADATRAGRSALSERCERPSDIDSALKQAADSNKRVLVEFGANWCSDCKALEENFRKTENAALLSSGFILVHVNVGDSGIDHNIELAQSYGIPLKKGVPALAVLEGDGSVVFSQKNGEFEDMRRMDPKSVNEFLMRWKR